LVASWKFENIVRREWLNVFLTLYTTINPTDPSLEGKIIQKAQGADDGVGDVSSRCG